MLAAYGVDVLDPAVTPRRVRVLVENLPPAARRPGQDWSTEADLLAVLVDHVAELTWVTLRGQGAKATRPRPLPRPRHGQAPPQPAAQPARNPRANNGGPVKYGTWAEAITALAAMPGVSGG